MVYKVFFCIFASLLSACTRELQAKRSFLYAPLRSRYKSNEKSCLETKNDTATSCVFCKQFADNSEKNDAQHFIIKRFSRIIVMLNLYPYLDGHLLILPIEHKKELYELDEETQQELIKVIAQATRIIKEDLSYKGVNIGMNLGKCAGASKPDHLHAHLLPRGENYTGFQDFLANTTVITQDMNKTYQTYRKLFSEVNV